MPCGILEKTEISHQLWLEMTDGTNGMTARPGTISDMIP